MTLRPAAIILVLSASILSLSSCQTISEDACRAGNWEDLGFKDGSQGRNRSRLASIGEDCAKYGIQPDRVAYISGLEEGLERYCTPDQGFRDGSNGGKPNSECSSLGYTAYLDGHDDGYADFLVRRDYADLQSRWTEIELRILEIETELDQPDLSRSDRRSIRARLRDLENVRDDIRVEVRQIERDYDWPRWRPDVESEVED